MEKQSKAMKDNKVTVRSFVWGAIFSAVFAVVTVYMVNRRGMCITGSQIPVLPYVLLVLTVLLINPICRLSRVIRPFSTVEVLLVFVMGLVSSGISTFGLSAQVIPVAGSLYNQAWNNEQSKWNQYVEPYLNEQFYVSEDGIQAAAVLYSDRVVAAMEKRRAYEVALVLSRTTEDAVRAGAALAAARARTSGSESDRALAVTRAELAASNAEKAGREAAAAWEMVRPTASTTYQVVLDSYPDLLEQADRETAEAKAALAELEAVAYKKVDLFRRGLPRELRAYPGIMPTDKDTFSGYVARIQRLRHGGRSLKLLAEARIAISEGRPIEETRALLAEAAECLRPISGVEPLRARKDGFDERVEEARTRSVAAAEELAALYTELRGAERDRIRGLENQIDDLEDEKENLDEAVDDLQVSSEKVAAQLEMAERVIAAAEELKALDADIGELDVAAAEARLAELSSQYALFDATLRRFLIGDVPWSHWVKPMGFWGGLIALTYMVLMAFNVLIFRQWAHNEKLIYPLAELPEHLAGAGDPDGRVPSIFKTGLFWLGFGISAFFLGWNMFCYLQVVPGLKAINLNNFWAPFIQKSVLEGLMPRTRSEIFFTMIGLSFLVPKKISFSLWFFSVLFMIQLLILVWSGYGVNYTSFPADWCYVLNFRMSEGGGAILVFSAVVLFKCRRYLLCCFNGSSIAELEADERRELRISSFLFLTGSVAVVLVLWLGMGANLGHSIFFYVVCLLVTVGLIRAVTEGGILSFQAWVGPFHLIRTITGMGKAWVAPPLFAPLMVYYSVFFFDIKTFIAPAMANALKIRHDLKMDRSRFHLAMFLCIAVACVVALLTEIMMSYSAGADQMSGWFYTGLPKMLYQSLSSMAQLPPEASGAQTGWIASGAIVMAVLLYLRQFCFWLPHPIGLVMLVNPLMISYWFSILLGWGAKSLVTKYGDQDLYAKMRAMFIGLIAGELLIVTLSMILSIVFDVRIPIDLNRNG